MRTPREITQLAMRLDYYRPNATGNWGKKYMCNSVESMYEDEIISASERTATRAAILQSLAGPTLYSHLHFTQPHLQELDRHSPEVFEAKRKFWEEFGK